MEPSTIYHGNKRNLAVSFGLLALVTLGSVEIVKADDAFPLIIKNPAIVQHILFAITAYCLYQFCLAWFYQRDEIRRKFGYDFVVTVGLAIAVINIYLFSLYKLAMPVLLTLSKIIAGLIMFVVLLAVAAVPAYAIYQNVELRRRVRDTFAIRRETLRDRLLKPGWILLFNPNFSDPRLTQKSISFELNGSIGIGRNDNEARWELDGMFLQILRSNGDLQNRFSYDEKTDRFLCTDDPAAKGIKGQIIFREQGF